MPYERGDVVSSRFTRSDRRSSSARIAPTVSSSAHGCPSGSCGAWRRSSFATPLLLRDRAPRHTPARRRVAAAGRLPGRRRPRSRCLRARRARPGERCVVPTGIAVAIPEGYAGLVIPRSGLALEHGISLVNTPGLIDSGYRGEVRVIALNTDRERPFTVRPACGSRSSSSRPSPRSTSCCRTSFPKPFAAAPASALRAPEAVVLQPRIRVSAVLRWRRRNSPLPARAHGREYWLLPGGERQLGREPRAGTAPGAARGGRHRQSDAVRRAGRDRGLHRACSHTRDEARRPHHLRRRPHGQVARDRELRGRGRPARHRLFTAVELDEVVLHPPIQRFLGRWQPGDPVVYLGALWAP